MAETGNQRDLTKGEKTKYRLARAMKECMKSTSVENITVKQITEECGLTRQTFYRQHDFELILEFYENLICEKSGKKAGENIHYLLEMYCQSSIYMTVRWVTGELTCTPEELAQTVVDGMPGKLAEVFVDLEILN